MKAFVKHASRQLFVLLVSVSVAFAQTPPPASRKAAATQPELDQMLAPIALYPDSLLSQIFMASTYPLEVVEAARWSRANPGLKGDEAVQAVEQKDWDASVKSLAAFPQVLAMMDQQLEWTARLGDVFIAQEPQVMETVQSLRQKAHAAGNLRSTEQATVSRQGEALAIEPVSSQVVYVPYYDPRVAYGSWWWPAYPPVYWGPWPGYYAYPGYPAFFWGFGITVGPRFFYSSCDWHRRRIAVAHVNPVIVNRPGVVNRPVVWRHDPVHRRGVPYRIESVQKQYGRGTAAGERRDFRWQGPIAPATRNSALNRPEAHGGQSRIDVPSNPRRPDANPPAARRGEARPQVHGPASRPHAVPVTAPQVHAGPGNIPRLQGPAPQRVAGQGQAGRHPAPSAGRAHGEGRGR